MRKIYVLRKRVKINGMIVLNRKYMISKLIKIQMKKIKLRKI